MNTKITALALLTVTALSFAPKPAHAGDKELAAIGGFIGGMIIGNAINNHRNDDYCPPPPRTTVIVDRGPDCRDDGYWKETRVKIWVPARWVYERDRRGCEVKRYVSGFYDYRTERVWVSYDRHDRHDRRGGRTVIVTRR